MGPWADGVDCGKVREPVKFLLPNLRRFRVFCLLELVFDMVNEVVTKEVYSIQIETPVYFSIGHTRFEKESIHIVTGKQIGRAHV